MQIKTKSFLAGTLTFLLCLAGGAYLVELNHELQLRDQNKLMQEIAASQALAIERRLTHSLSATYILAQELRRGRGQIDDFDRFADQVIRSIGGISNLQLAPNGIIDRIYPLAGNERAIGHNLLVDDARRAEAKLAIEQKQLTLAGPFGLIQGGVGIIGRNPVFLNQDGKETFWGFASALIYLDDLIKFTELNALTDRDFQYQLSRIHPDTEQREIFSGQKVLDVDVKQSFLIRVPNGEWLITIGTPYSYSHVLGYTITVLLSLLISMMIYHFVRIPEQLQITVDRQTEKLRHLAFKDHLTGLANRRLLLAQIKQEILDLKRNHTLAALLCVDLDDFKRINDTMGHDAGDTLLQKTAARFRDTLRSNDIIARLGGDEFAILLVDVGNYENVSRVTGNLLAVMQRPVTIQNHELVVTGSIGITLIPNDGDNDSELLRHADLALYAAKRQGKNNYQFFNPEMQNLATQNLAIERDLRLAIENEQFVLHFQPIVSLSERRISSYEALIRWQHPEKGLLAPDQFIPEAEATHLIIPIGYWVIRQACDVIAQRRFRGKEPVRIAINLAPQQFNDPELATTVMNILEETGAASHWLEFEITETALMENLEVAVNTLKQLRKMGIQISIDDFGTGYSSLSQLKTLPLDTLKIDRSFVDGVGEEGHDRQIVEAIIAMASKLHLHVVAEGIETPEQLDFLVQQQAEYGQGYLFNRPLPESSMMDQALDLSLCWPNSETLVSA